MILFSRATGGKLGKATLNATLAHLKRFFQWPADKPGCKSRLQRPQPARLIPIGVRFGRMGLHLLDQHAAERRESGAGSN